MFFRDKRSSFLHKQWAFKERLQQAARKFLTRRISSFKTLNGLVKFW
jgi:hypothetical protein